MADKLILTLYIYIKASKNIVSKNPQEGRVLVSGPWTITSKLKYSVQLGKFRTHQELTELNQRGLELNYTTQ